MFFAGDCLKCAIYIWTDNNGNIREPRRQRQRERGKTKGLISRTMALHVHYKTLYISHQ